MDKFVKRAKRKSSPDASISFTPKPELVALGRDEHVKQEDEKEDEDEPTDIKLARLSSVHPDLDQHLLLDFLLAHNGSVKATLESIKVSSQDHLRLDSKPSSKIKTVGAQTSLKLFAIPAPPTASTTPGSESGSPATKKPKLLSRKGATLHLYDPEDIAQHTPCTVIHNFLPEEEANGLLKELLEESKSFQKITFKLFDNVVSSPHTMGFYVGTDYEMAQQQSEYVYNGSRIEVGQRCTYTHDPFLMEGVPNKHQQANQHNDHTIRYCYRVSAG